MQYTCYKPPEMFIALHRIVGGLATSTLCDAIKNPLPDEPQHVREAMALWFTRLSPDRVVTAWYKDLEEHSVKCAEELRVRASVKQLEKHAAELGYKLVKL